MPSPRKSTDVVIGYAYWPFAAFAGCCAGITLWTWAAGNPDYIFPLVVSPLLLLIVAAYMSKLVLDDGGIHYKRLLWPWSRSIAWAQIASCDIETINSGRNKYNVLIVTLIDGRRQTVIPPRQGQEERLRIAIYDRIQDRWRRETGLCTRCKFDLRQSKAGATACERCQSDLAPSELKWLREYHRRAGQAVK